MGDDITVDFDSEGFERAMKKAPLRLMTEMRKRVTPYLSRWVRREFAGNRFQNFRPGGTSGDRLHRRSGRLSRSFNVRQTGTTLDTLAWMTGAFGVEYANVQEFGATITPKRAKYLTIPVGEALTPAGNPRFTAREALQQPNVRFASGRGGPIIVREEGDRVETLFILRKRVRVPGRLGFYDGFDRQMTQLLTRMNQAIDAALDERGDT